MVEGIDDLVVHRPAMLRVGMEHQGDRGRGALAMLIAPSNRPSGPFMITSGIADQPRNLEIREKCTNPSVGLGISGLGGRESWS